KDRKSLSAYIGSTIRADVDVMNATNYTTDNVYGVWVAADFDEPSKYSAFILQGGLSLPDREYYLSDSPQMKEVRDAFKTHIEKVLTLGGVPDAKKKAERIFDLENKIARVHATVAETSEPSKGNNHWPRADFEKKAPGMDWPAFLDAAGLSGQTMFV